MRKILSLLLCIPGFCLYGQMYNAGTAFTVYQDIVPDTLLNYYFPSVNETYGIDLFDDASADIEFAAHGGAGSGGTAALIKVSSLNPHVYIRFGRWDSVFITGTTYWNVTKIAKPLASGEPINSADAIWEDSTLYLTDHSGQTGGVKDVNDWIGGDKYLGLKYINGGQVDYAWVRVNCITKDSCYLKDYSHTPSALAISEIKDDKMILYPNPANRTFYMKGISTNAYNKLNLKIIDIYAREVGFTSEFTNDCLKINLNPDVTKGCYLLKCFSNDHLVSQKLINVGE